MRTCTGEQAECQLSAAISQVATNHLEHHAQTETEHRQEEHHPEAERDGSADACGRNTQRGKVLNGDFRDRDLVAGLAWRFDLGADEVAHQMTFIKASILCNVGQV